MTKYVLISRFCKITGYTEEAVRTKIKTGVWLEGKVWLKAADGHVMINIEGYELWVESAQVLQRRQARATKSPSPIAGKDAANESKSSPAPLTAVA